MGQEYSRFLSGSQREHHRPQPDENMSRCKDWDNIQVFKELDQDEKSKQMTSSVGAGK